MLEKRVGLGELDKDQIVFCQADANVAGKATGAVLYVQPDGRYAVGSPEDADRLRLAGYVVGSCYV